MVVFLSLYFVYMVKYLEEFNWTPLAGMHFFGFHRCLEERGHEESWWRGGGRSDLGSRTLITRLFVVVLVHFLHCFQHSTTSTTLSLQPLLLTPAGNMTIHALWIISKAGGLVFSRSYSGTFPTHLLLYEY